MSRKPYAPYAPDLALTNAVRTGILVASGRADREPLAREWYVTCAQNRQPYVRVKPRRLYTTVELDLRPAGYIFSLDALEVVTILGRRYGTTHGRFTITLSYVNIGGVAQDRAMELADRLLSVALEDRQRHA